VSGYMVLNGNDVNNSSDYTITTLTNTTGQINAAALTLTALTNTKNFDGTTSAAAIPTVSGLIGSDTVSELSETYDTAAAGTGKTLSVVSGYTVSDGNSGNDYAVATVTNTTGEIDATTLATSTTITDAGPNPSQVSTTVDFVVNVSFTGSVSALNGETITLEDASNSNAVVGTGLISSGTVTIPVSSLTVGTHYIFAVFPGDSNYMGSQSSQVTQTVSNTPAITATATVNGASATGLTGTQRSMVTTIEYVFSEPVNNPASAFTLAIDSGASVNTAGFTLGTVPTMNWSNPSSDGETWILTFSGSGVTGGSIADGVYNLTLDAADVTPTSGSDTFYGPNPVTTFARLFGAQTGTTNTGGGPTDHQLTVSNTDKLRFNGAFNNAGSTFTAAFNYTNHGGAVSNSDKLQFNKRFNVTYTY
jgi:hypothetical protein